MAMSDMAEGKETSYFDYLPQLYTRNVESRMMKLEIHHNQAHAKAR